jgi:alpha-mannosidase
VVAAPGLPEGELLDDGAVAVTLVRAVGWLSRYGLATRAEPAGPGVPTPGAQCPGPFQAEVSLFADGPDTPRRARATELGLRAVIGGDAPLLASGRSLLGLTPATLVLSALKPAEDGDGAVVRVLNPTDEPVDAQLSFGLPVASATVIRLDEEPADWVLVRDNDVVQIVVPPHGLRSVRVHWSGG